MLRYHATVATNYRSITVKPLMMSRATDIISRAVEDKADSLQELSGKIWSHPELCFEEKFAHDTLTEFLEKNGFEVERKYKVDTAFKAVFRQGSGGANIGLICEYDALPDIGHACGHNLIAESGESTGTAVRRPRQHHHHHDHHHYDISDIS